MKQCNAKPACDGAPRGRGVYPPSLYRWLVVAPLTFYLHCQNMRNQPSIINRQSLAIETFEIGELARAVINGNRIK